MPLNYRKVVIDLDNGYSSSSPATHVTSTPFFAQGSTSGTGGRVGVIENMGVAVNNATSVVSVYGQSSNPQVIRVAIEGTELPISYQMKNEAVGLNPHNSISDSSTFMGSYPLPLSANGKTSLKIDASTTTYGINDTKVILIFRLNNASEYLGVFPLSVGESSGQILHKDIPLYKPSLIPDAQLRIGTSNGIGVVNTISTASATTPLRIQTSSGVEGVAEHFEESSQTRYTSILPAQQYNNSYGYPDTQVISSFPTVYRVLDAPKNCDHIRVIWKLLSSFPNSSQLLGWNFALYISQYPNGGSWLKVAGSDFNAQALDKDYVIDATFSDRLIGSVCVSVNGNQGSHNGYSASTIITHLGTRTIVTAKH